MNRLYQGLAIATLFLITTMCRAQTPEFRGLYVDAFHPGLNNHEEVTQMVNAAKGAKFNALFVQVRKRGDAYYQSSIEPKAASVAANYDPLADIILQAHAAGMEVHAWLAVYEVSNTAYTEASSHVSKAHAKWLMSDRDGKTTVLTRKIFLDPGISAVQDYVVALVTEIIQNYDVDGIYLDNPGYPDKNLGYNAASVAAFNHKFSKSGLPADDDEAWRQWRADQVTALIRKAHDAVTSAKPKVKFSASVISEDPGLAKTLRMQDWARWTKEGLVDFVVPMLFFNADLMEDIAKHALAARNGREVYVGIGAYKLSVDQLGKHISGARAAGATGLLVYNYHYLMVNPTDTITAKMADLAGSIFAQSAGIPAMSWKIDRQGEQ